MKICLVSAATANRLRARMDDEEASRMMGELAPVGILSLAAVLEGEGLQPEVVDLNRVYYNWLRDPKSGADFCTFAAAYLGDRDAGLFGFSTVCSSYPLTLRIAAELKRFRNDSVVVLGGPQASVVDEPTMRAFPAVDLIVRGEAELTLPEVIDALGGRKALATVPGITFRESGSIVRNPDAPPVLDLDALPFPAFHLFPDVRFCRHFPLELGRGCPFACTFCSTNDFFRRRFRLKSPARMIADMSRVRRTYGINSFELVHDMFTVDRKRVEAFCEALLESGEEFTWGCSARTDCIDEELIALMARAGCRGIFFGIETGSRRMQKIIEKDLDLSDSADRVRSCDEAGINTAVSLMAGFPEETMEDVRATAAFFVDSLRWDHADPQLSILSPLAGTPIERQWKESLVLSDSLGDLSYRGWPQTDGDHAVIAAHREIFSSFYSVPSPHVDHEFVKELRDFLLSGAKTFRRLLLGLHQDSGDIVDVFQRWREWRVANGIDFSGGDRASYFARQGFVSDFLSFVGVAYIPEAPLAVATLAAYETALLRDASGAGVSAATDHDGQPLTRDSRPTISPEVRVVVLPADYQEVVRRLRGRIPLNDLPVGSVKLTIRRNANGGVEARQLSPLSADLLDLCEGLRTVGEIAAKFRDDIRSEASGVPPEIACFAGLEILRQQGLIAAAPVNVGR